jgi:PAS domain S-box-containing protein
LLLTPRRLTYVDLGRWTGVVLVLPALVSAGIWLVQWRTLVEEPEESWRSAAFMAGALTLQLLAVLLLETRSYRLEAHGVLAAAAVQSVLAGITSAVGHLYAVFYAFVVLVAGLKWGMLAAVGHLFFVTLCHTAAGHGQLLTWLGLAPLTSQPAFTAVTPAAALFLIVLAKYADVVTKRFRYLEALHDHISDGLFILNEQAVILDVNPQAMLQTGRTRPELVGRSLFELCVVETGAQGTPEAIWRRCLQEGRGRFDIQWVRPDGSRLPAEMAAQRVDGLRPVQIQALSRDMSQWRALEAAIQRQNEQLRRVNVELQRSRDLALEASRLKSRFLATMSHELKTPLNSIIGYTRLVLEGGSSLEPQSQADLRRVLRAAEHLLELINGLLDLARIEAGKEPVEWSKVPLIHVVSSALDAVAPQAAQKRLALVVESQADDLIIETDERKLWRVLVNLLSNAVQYTESGRVVVRIRGPVEETVFIAVEDTGWGIPAQDLPYIFDEFHQAQNRHRQTGTGTGLGLAITRRLVDLLGGSIQVQSAEGKGTCFTVSLPLKAPVAKEETSNITLDPVSSGLPEG